jgi:hypothetical protein
MQAIDTRFAKSYASSHPIRRLVCRRLPTSTSPAAKTRHYALLNMARDSDRPSRLGFATASAFGGREVHVGHGTHKLGFPPRACRDNAR